MLTALAIAHETQHTSRRRFFDQSCADPQHAFSKAKNKFTREDDRRLAALVDQYGTEDWSLIAEAMESRNMRQCRERWTHYLQPNLRTGSWTPDEDQLLEEMLAEHGTKWNKISTFFVNRAPLSLRNRHMALSRRRWKAMSATDARPVVTSVEREEAAPNGPIARLFSDEELKTLLEDIFS
jgi:hypothetical protein